MLKPSELKKKNFTKAVRGYSTTEVDEYMGYMLEKYTELFRRNFELEQQLRVLNEQKSELESEKESVKTVLANAQKVASSIIEKANTRAGEIIESARVAGNAVLSDLNEHINAERETALSIKNQVNSLKRSLFETYREHIERIDNLTRITDSVKIKSSDEYLNDAVNRAQKALKNLKAADKAEVNLTYEVGDTAETPIVREDDTENEIVETTALETAADSSVSTAVDTSDTLVFEKVKDSSDGQYTDNSATLVIDKVNADDNE